MIPQIENAQLAGLIGIFHSSVVFDKFVELIFIPSLVTIIIAIKLTALTTYILVYQLESSSNGFSAAFGGGLFGILMRSNESLLIDTLASNNMVNSD